MCNLSFVTSHCKKKKKKKFAVNERFLNKRKRRSLFSYAWKTTSWVEIPIYQKHVRMLKQLALFPSRRNLSHEGSNLTTRKIRVNISTYITAYTKNSNDVCDTLNLPRILRAYTENVSSVRCTIQKPKNSP